MRGFSILRLAAAVTVAGLCALPVMPAAAQGSYSPYDEGASVAMARYIRNLASDPKDFASLIGAGKAALALNDPFAAAGFFARADEVNSRSPQPQAGMGAVAVANGQPQAALPYFKRAQDLGLPVASFACDRGLAYDLLGQQAQAQADYRLALNGTDADEARRRMALSMAIAGNRNGALQALAPLSAKGDSGVARVRALVLALTGDSNAAVNAINAAMPGSASDVAPFLSRLASLTAGQKAAAVNLGIFPDTGLAYAYGSRAGSVAPAPPVASGNRLADLDSLLNGPPQSAAPATPAVQLASVSRPTPAVVQRTAAMFQPKIWLQLASGQDVDDFASRFQRMKNRNPDLFEGIRPYVARSADRARLLIGPFRGASDAAILAEDLHTAGLDAFKFTNSESDRIAPLPAE